MAKTLDVNCRIQNNIRPYVRILSYLTLLMIICLVLTSFSAACDPIVYEHLYGDRVYHECRFWGMVASSLPETVVLNHLVDSSDSLKNLGASNPDGWGLAYYKDSLPEVFRGEPPADIDPNFNSAANKLAKSGAHVGIGHVRKAAPGALDIPDPHPFIREKNGKWWSFGHDGALSKTLLKKLIGSAYLSENPPRVGNSWDDPNVVDSDLYMLYILKCVEDNSWNVTAGIAKAVNDIVTRDSGAMNFFLTDGEMLWGFCRGNTLYYYYNETSPQYAAIASQPPSSIDEGWIALSDYNLITLSANDPPSIITDITVVPEFSEAFVLPLSIVATLTAFALCKRKAFTSAKTHD